MRTSLRKTRLGDAASAPLPTLDAAIADARAAWSKAQANASLTTSQMAVAAQKSGAAFKSAALWHGKVKASLDSPQDAAASAIQRNVAMRQSLSDRVRAEVLKDAAFKWTVSTGLRRRILNSLLGAAAKRNAGQPYTAEVNVADALSTTADTIEQSATDVVAQKPSIALDPQFSQKRIDDIANRYGIDIGTPGASQVVPAPGASMMFDSDAQRQTVSQLFPFSLPVAFQPRSVTMLSGAALLGLGDDAPAEAGTNTPACDFMCSGVKAIGSIGGSVSGVLSKSSASVSDPTAKNVLSTSGGILSSLNSMVNGAITSGESAISQTDWTIPAFVGIGIAALGGWWLYRNRKGA